MPRSYSFDHFQTAATEPRSRSQLREDKRHLAGSRHPPSAQGEELHYGRSHAETEEILKARAQEPPGPGPAAQPVGRGTTPIGALPATEELPPRGRFQDLLDEATRQLEVLHGSVGDVGKAVVRLASLPIEVVRLAARRLRRVPG